MMSSSRRSIATGSVPNRIWRGKNKKRSVGANGPPCQTARSPSMICSTVRERSGSTAASVPTAVSVWLTPPAWVRATFEKLP